MSSMMDKIKVKDYVPGIIYRNAGITFFLSILSGISLMIYRTSSATSNFNSVKDKLQDSLVLVPEEQVELMIENRAFSSTIFADIASSLPSAFPTNKASYSDFVSHVQGYLEAPIKVGHYLDRIILERRTSSSPSNQEEDVRFLMTLLSLVMETETLEDRASVLFKMISNFSQSESGGNILKVSPDKVADIIEYLHLTNQLPIEKKVLKTAHEYPVQTYEVASAEDLLSEALIELKLGDTHISEDDFVNILLSNAICAWGSCRPRR
jgi:hypothetical protein